MVIKQKHGMENESVRQEDNEAEKPGRKMDSGGEPHLAGMG